MRPELWLRFGAPWVAIIAIFLPALTASAPLLPPQHWSSFDVCRSTANLAGSHPRGEQQPSLQDLLRHVEELRRQISSDRDGSVPLVFKLAILVPVMLVLLAFIAVLLVIASFFGWWRITIAAAITGVVASAYTIIAAWLLTNSIQRDLAASLDRARHSFHMHALAELSASLAGQVGLHAEAALYLMLLACLSVLIVPKAGTRDKG